MRSGRRQTVSSYGIICYRLKIDFEKRNVYPEYMLVQRKDSLAMVEFVRGKYTPDDMDYVRKLLASMTPDEKALVACEPFDELWTRVWGKRSPHGARSFTEHSNSRQTHAALVARCGGDLAGLVRSVAESILEREHGFPKGRKNSGESDIACAVREFSEETGMDPSCIHIYSLRPYEELFEGSDGNLYRHVYYLARAVDMRGGPIVCPSAGTSQAKEVSAVRWVAYAEMCSKFARSPSRLTVAERANADVFRVLAPDPDSVSFVSLSHPASPPSEKVIIGVCETIHPDGR